MAEAPAARPVEERRSVAILFCDLAGFTARSDRADPEDVRRILVPFHEAAKREIERHGGHLDKFIGDAALGVFGAPVAHEDDPLRAVEAALAILRSVREIDERSPGLGLSARGAVAFGEAVVELGGSGPRIGEAVAGDVVNTASRLQSIAEEGSLGVDRAVYLATRGRVDATPLGEVTVKGKREPLEVWRLDRVRPVAPRHERTTEREPAFVGRERELDRLDAVLDEVRETRSARLALVVGEPGIGKSRVLRELSRRHEERAEPVRWLWGRCPPYGEGVTYTAIEQLVREAAGVMPDAPAGQVVEDLREAVAAVGEGAEDVDWLSGHLARLLGVREAGDAAQVDESVGAWVRYLEAFARGRPTVLAVEDLHWAEPPLLALVDRLREAGAPLLVLATARPELAESRPSWPHAERVAWLEIPALSAAEVGDLIDFVAPGDVARLDPEQRSSMLDSAGGNPLYAVEFARMLADGGDVVEIPRSVRGLIAARLDTLPTEERALLQDAAVVGRSFWVEAIPSAEPVERGQLEDLRGRGFLRAEGEDAYRFTHALVRDVAYGQLTRGGRLRRHRMVADWLAGGAEWVPDRVELEAHHRRSALELARALGDPDLREIADAASSAFVAAAEHRRGLDLAGAVGLYREALDAADPDDPQRAWLVVREISSARRAGLVDPSETERAYREAIERALAAGYRHLAADALVRLSMDLAIDRLPEAAREALQRSIDLLEDLPPTLTTARAYAVRAEDLDFAGRYREALPWLERATAVLETIPGSGIVPPRPAGEPLESGGDRADDDGAAPAGRRAVRDR